LYPHEWYNAPNAWLWIQSNNMILMHVSLEQIFPANMRLWTAGSWQTKHRHNTLAFHKQINSCCLVHATFFVSHSR
jgi:hypothetical protein